MTKAIVYNTGLVTWHPPAVYKSSCSIDVEYFPYDLQTCVLKLGSWTYDGFKVPEKSIITTIHLQYYFSDLNETIRKPFLTKKNGMFLFKFRLEPKTKIYILPIPKRG